MNWVKSMDIDVLIKVKINNLIKTAYNIMYEIIAAQTQLTNLSHNQTKT